MAKEELENRGIPEHAWVKTVKSCMSPEVLDSFRTAFCSNRTVVIAIRLLPHKRQQVSDPFEYTEWDELCNWLLKHRRRGRQMGPGPKRWRSHSR